MFWRFGGYANISTIDTILDKPDVSLEELLDESDLIQELKQNNSKLIEYLREEDILRRLLQYVIAPKPEDDGAEGSAIDDSSDQDPAVDPEWHLKEERPRGLRRRMTNEEREREEKIRLKYAYVACEILSSETWSILEALMEYQHHLRDFWTYLKRSAPLDPLQAGYFTKVNETLLDKKTEEMLEFFKSLENVVPDMLKHVDCPMIMDLLLKIISLEKAEGGQGIVNWLQSQDLVPILLSCLEPGNSASTQTSAGDFIKAVITISANASQNEQSCIGPNNLTRQLVSEPCISKLISDMLCGGNSLTVGVGIVIEVIRKNNSDYDPEIGNGPDAIPSSRDPIYLGTLLRAFARHVPDFMHLILNPCGNPDPEKPSAKRELKVAFGGTIEPLGFDRFKTCELMAELLHCSNMALLNERGSDAFMKARDTERERLKNEGRLDVFGEDHTGGEFGEGASYANAGSPLRRSSESPEEIRRLEVQNGGEEDGFEDVTVSGVLNEDAKDDFEEKEESGNDSRDSDDPFADRQADDSNDFVDEPLSSPRLNPRPSLKISDDELSSLVSPEPTENDPLSPTAAGLTGRVGELGLHHDTTMASPSSGSGEEEQAGSAPKPMPVPAQTNSPVKEHPDIIGGGPNDLPAPLFANRSPISENLQQQSPEEPGEGISQGYTNVAPHEGDTSIISGSMSGEEARYDPESTELHIEIEEDGAPVVGDYLKLMFIQHKVVPTILDFFFRFPWNNFLHNVVYDVVQQVFNGPMNRGRNRHLAFDLFDTGRITEKIVDGQKRSDKAQSETSIRLGYMGHLTLIAEEVVKFTERHPPEMLSQSVLDKVMHQDWITYVEQTLAETRERDNAILGGVRPDMSLGPRQAAMNSVNQGFGGSSALANAGLNGGAGLDSMELNHGSTTSGGFSISGGSLLSGFGSSSDEEDEEMEEGEEDDGAHRGSNVPGSDHSTTENSSSSSSKNKYKSAATYASLFPSLFSSSSSSSNNQHQRNDDDEDNSEAIPLSLYSSPTKKDISANATPTNSSGGHRNGNENEPSNISDSFSFGPSPNLNLSLNLNIPPSRARRQLAVQLAKRQQREAEAEAEAAGQGQQPGSAEPEHNQPGVEGKDAEDTGHVNITMEDVEDVDVEGGIEGDDEREFDEARSTLARNDAPFRRRKTRWGFEREPFPGFAETGASELSEAGGEGGSGSGRGRGRGVSGKDGEDTNDHDNDEDTDDTDDIDDDDDDDGEGEEVIVGFEGPRH